MKLALKIDVSTLRGTRDGVPALIDVLERHAAGATFFLSLGPDHAARSFRRAIGHGRDAALASESHARSLFYGTLLPAPYIGRRARAVLRSIRAAGFETALSSHDAAAWQRHAASANAEWTAAALQRAVDRYVDVFDEAPRAHAAFGWQSNRHALRLTQRLGFDYCSDARGSEPFLPVWDGELVRCPQLPTTLPTLDELARDRGLRADALAVELLARTAAEPYDHIFTLRAELEGLELVPAFEQLVLGWKAQGYELVPLGSLLHVVEPMALPRCEVSLASVPGRSAPLLVQGREFLAEVELPRAA